MPSPTQAISDVPKEVKVDLRGGVKVRLYRNEPFRFYAEIHKWLDALNIGSIQALHMSTDANGWINYTIAYTEAKDGAPAYDAVLVQFDTAALLKDVAESVERIAKLLSDDHLGDS